MDARRSINNCTRWWVVVLVALSTRLPGLLAWECSARDRDTLLGFKAGFVDVGGVFSTWNAGSNCCTWVGVRCEERNGAVVELTIVGNGDNRSYRNPRYGKVGAGLVALTSLQQLTIQWLLLNEPIPSEWGGFSGNLLVLVINDANLYDNIPSSLASIPNLQTLDLRSNHLTGNIPPEFCKQRSFRFIDVSYNYMNPNPVPWCLQNQDVIVVFNNQGQNTYPPGPPGMYPPPGGWYPPMGIGSHLSVPSIAFKVVFGVLLVWTLL